MAKTWWKKWQLFVVKSLKADAVPYADELESYVSRQLTFVGDAEYQVKQASSTSSGMELWHKHCPPQKRMIANSILLF